MNEQRSEPTPAHDDETAVNLQPGQQDEGGHGGMATRELAAKEEKEAPTQGARAD